MEARPGTVERRLDKMEARFEKMETQLERLEALLTKVRDDKSTPDPATSGSKRNSPQPHSRQPTGNGGGLVSGKNEAGPSGEATPTAECPR